MEQLSVFPLYLLLPLQIPELEEARQWKKGRGKKAEGLPSISCPGELRHCWLQLALLGQGGGELGVGPGQED